jgi:hypothetical protein
MPPEEQHKMICPTHTLDYSVWGPYQSYLEEPPQSKLLARFVFLQEAIDYAMSASKASSVVLCGPYSHASVYADGQYRPDLHEIRWYPRITW